MMTRRAHPLGAGPTGETAGARGDLEAFVLYRVLSRAYFHLPVLFVFFYLGGMSIFQTELLLAAYGILVSVGAGLSPRIAQRLSPSLVAALGEGLKAVGVGMLPVGPGLATGIVGQSVAALGYGLAAGVDSTLLAAICAREGHSYARQQSTGASYMLLSAFLAGVVGAVFFVEGAMSWPFYASALVSLLAGLTVLTVQSAPPPSLKEEGPTTTTTPRLGRRDRYWLHYYVISRAFLLAPFVGFLPYLFFVEVRVPLLWFGVILGLFGLAAFASARLSAVWTDLIAPHRLAWLSMVVSALALGLLAIYPSLWTGLIGVLLLGLGGGLVRPITMSQLHEATAGWGATHRAALISSLEIRYGLLNALVLLLGGTVLEALGLRFLLVGVALAYVALLLLLRLWSRRPPANPEAPEGPNARRSQSPQPHAGQ